jgi:putative DNA primase/helicase
MSVGAELLTDIQELFQAKGVDRIATRELIEALCADEEKPWATYNRGRPISPRQAARKLAEYGIASSTIRIGHGTVKGYLIAWFEEAFKRYLPIASVTTSHANTSGGSPVTDTHGVTVTDAEKVTAQAPIHKGCDAVTDTKQDQTQVVAVVI